MPDSSDTAREKLAAVRNPARGDKPGEKRVIRERARRAAKRREEEAKRAIAWAAPRSVFLPPPAKGGVLPREKWAEREPFTRPVLTPAQLRDLEYQIGRNRIRTAAGLPQVGPLAKAKLEQPANVTDVVPGRKRQIIPKAGPHGVYPTGPGIGITDLPGRLVGAARSFDQQMTDLSDRIVDDLGFGGKKLLDQITMGEGPVGNILPDTGSKKEKAGDPSQVLAAMAYSIYNVARHPGRTADDAIAIADGASQLLAAAVSGELDLPQLYDAIKESYKEQYGPNWKYHSEHDGLFGAFDAIALTNVASRALVAGSLVKSGKASNLADAFRQTFERGQYTLTADLPTGPISAQFTRFQTPVGRGLQRVGKAASEQFPLVPVVGARSRVARRSARADKQTRRRNEAAMANVLRLITRPEHSVPFLTGDPALTRLFWEHQLAPGRGTEGLVALRDKLQEIKDTPLSDVNIDALTQPVEHPLRTAAIEAMREVGLPEDQQRAFLSLADATASAHALNHGGDPAQWWDEGAFGGGLQAVKASKDPTDLGAALFQRDDMDPIYIGTLQREAQELMNMVEGKRRLHKPGSKLAQDALPPGVKTVDDVVKLMHSVRVKALLAKADRWWYERSARAIVRHVGGDLEKADRLAQIIAILSPRNAVKRNVEQAIQYWDELERSKGKKVPSLDALIERMKAEKGVDDSFPKRLENQKRKILAAYAGKKKWNIGSITESERKTHSFYRSFLYYINREEYLRVWGNEIPVPVDVWMMKAFGYTDELPSPAQYDFIEGLIQRMAKQMEWTPDQVMAALWTKVQQDELSSVRGMDAISPRGHLVNPIGQPMGGQDVSAFLPKRKVKEPRSARVLRMRAKAAWKRAEEEGGFSIDPDTLKPLKHKDGYAVSWGAYESRMLPNSDPVSMILEYRHNPDLPTDQPGAMIGGWVYNGEYYLDVSRKIDDLREALVWAREQGQMAIRDFANDQDIPTGLTEAEADAIKTRLMSGDPKPAADPDAPPPGYGPEGAPVPSEPQPPQGPVGQLLADIEEADAAGADIYAHMDNTQLLEAANLALDQGDQLGWTREHYEDLYDGIEARLKDELGVDSPEGILRVSEGLHGTDPLIGLINRWEALEARLRTLDDEGHMAALDDAGSGASDVRGMRQEERSPSQQWADQHRQEMHALARDAWTVLSDEEIKQLRAVRGSNKGRDIELFNAMRKQGLIDAEGNKVKAPDVVPANWARRADQSIDPKKIDMEYWPRDDGLRVHIRQITHDGRPIGPEWPAEDRWMKIAQTYRTALRGVSKYGPGEAGARRAALAVAHDLGDQEVIAWAERHLKPDVPDFLSQTGDGGVVKGAVEFLDEGKKVVHLFEAADVSTFIHEFLGHSLPFYLARWEPDSVKALENWVKKPLAEWTDVEHEQLARGYEKYIRNNHAPNDAVRGAFQILSTYLRKLYDHVKDFLPGGIPKPVKELFDRSLGGRAEVDILEEARRQKNLEKVIKELDEAIAWEPNERYEAALAASRTVNNETLEVFRSAFNLSAEHLEALKAREGLLENWLFGDEAREGAGYMPHSWMTARQKKLRGTGSSSVGKNIPLNPSLAGLTLHQKNQLRLVASGNIEPDPRLLEQHFRQTLALQMQVEVRDWLWENADDITLGRPGVRSLWEPDPDKADKHSVVLISKDSSKNPDDWLESQRTGSAADMEEALRDYFNDVVVMPGSDRYTELLKRVEQADPNVRQIDRKFVEQFLLNLYGPNRMKLQGKTTQAFDLGLTAAKIGILYANFPGYHIANLVGNSLFLGMESGVLGIPQLLAVTKDVGRLLAGKVKGMTPEEARNLFRQIGAEMGHGLAGAPDQTPIGYGRLGQAQQVAKTFTDYSAGIVDNWPRAVAWAQQARRMGYKGPKDWQRLFKAENRADLDTIRDRSLDAMVDFDQMSVWERHYLARWLFVYPWIRGATKWAATYPVRKPEQATALAAASRAQHEQQEALLERLKIHKPSWLTGAYVTERNGKTARIFNFSSFTPFGPLRDLGRTISYLKGGPVPKNQTLYEYLAPVVDAAINISRGQNKYGKSVGYGKSVADNLYGFLPSSLRGVVAPEKASNVYADQSALGSLTRSVRVLPFEIDIEEANRAYESEQPGKPKSTDPNVQVQEWVVKQQPLVKALDLEDVPADILRAKRRYLHFLTARRMLAEQEGVGVSDLTPWQETAVMVSILEHSIDEFPAENHARIREVVSAMKAGIAARDEAALEEMRTALSQGLGWSGEGGLGEWEEALRRLRAG